MKNTVILKIDKEKENVSVSYDVDDDSELLQATYAMIQVLNQKDMIKDLVDILDSINIENCDIEKVR